jgi:hypothetical protein
MDPRFLAGCLLALAAATLCGIIPAAFAAAKAGSILGVALAAATGLGAAAVLANAAVDVWAAT